MKFWPVEVLISSWYTTWIIVDRVHGDVDTLEAGQTRWEPVFRSRRLNAGGRARVWENSKAILRFADESELHLPGPVETRFIQSMYPACDTSKVINMRAHKVGHSILLFFGKQYRYEVKSPGGSLGGRG